MDSAERQSSWRWRVEEDEVAREGERDRDLRTSGEGRVQHRKRWRGRLGSQEELPRSSFDTYDGL